MSSARMLSVFYAPRPKNLSDTELVLLMYLVDLYDAEKHCAWIRKSGLAERMGCSERRIQTLIATLEEKGYLRVYERVKRHNRYVVPLLPGEILPAKFVIHEGPTLIDSDERGKVWKLRSPGGGTVAEPAWVDPATPVDVAAMAAEDATLVAAEDAFAAAVAVDPEMERNAQKRGWYDFLVGLQGAAPLGKKAGEWDAVINDCMAKGISMEDFSACYAAAQKKWDAKAVITPTSVYNNWDSLFPIVKAERTLTRRRETLAAKSMASEKPAPLTDDEREAARIAAEAIRDGQAKRQAVKEWRAKNNIWTPNHTPGCACGTCASNKRQWERQRTAQSAQVSR